MWVQITRNTGKMHLLRQSVWSGTWDSTTSQAMLRLLVHGPHQQKMLENVPKQDGLNCRTAQSLWLFWWEESRPPSKLWLVLISLRRQRTVLHLSLSQGAPSRPNDSWTTWAWAGATGPKMYTYFCRSGIKSGLKGALLCRTELWNFISIHTSMLFLFVFL